MAEYIKGNEPPARGGGAGRTARGARDQGRVTLVACSPLSLTCTSNSTACPSARVLQPSITHVGEPSLGAVQGAIQLAIAQHGADIAARLRARHELGELVGSVGPRPSEPAAYGRAARVVGGRRHLHAPAEAPQQLGEVRGAEMQVVIG